MKIATLNGSTRPGNYTAKALAIIHDELVRYPDVTVTVIEPGKMRLAIPGSGMDDSDKETLQTGLADADGVVLATPEYHGTFTSLLKLAIENMGFPSALKNKPTALMGVASGRIGAVKSLEHLRSVCGHVGAYTLPRVVSIPNVNKAFDEAGNCLDPDVERQLRNQAKDLLKYVFETSCNQRSFEEWVRDYKASA